MVLTNYSIKKKIIFAVLLFGAISAFPIYRAFIAAPGQSLEIFEAIPTQEQIQQTVQAIAQNGSSVTEALATQLNNKYEQLIADIQKEFPAEEWASLRTVLADIKSRDQLLTQNPVVVNDPQDHPFVKTIKETLATYNIDPSKVTIEFVDTPQSFMAAAQGYEKGAVKHYIRINVAAITKKSDDVLLAFLKHEIMHLLNYDAIEGMFIKDLLQKNGATQEQISGSASLIAFKKFKEYRADLLASDNPKIAESLINDFEKRIELFPDEQVNPTHTSHPTELQRKEAVNNLLSYLKAETNIVVA